MTEADFRAAYPEFFDATTYTSLAITGLLSIASARLKSELWQDTLTQGTGLFVAHYLALNAKQTLATGTPQAVMTSKSVDGVSASYDYSFSAVKDAGFWNLTSYGQQFIYLARMVGKCAPSQFFGCF